MINFVAFVPLRRFPSQSQGEFDEKCLENLEFILSLIEKNLGIVVISPVLKRILLIFNREICL